MAFMKNNHTKEQMVLHWENLRSWFNNGTNYCLWELGQRPSITQQTRFWNSLLFCWRNIDGIHDSLDRLNDLPGSDCVLLKLGLHGRLGYKFLWNPWSTFLSHHCATIIRDHVMIKTNQNKIPTVRFYLHPSTCFSLSSLVACMAESQQTHLLMPS